MDKKAKLEYLKGLLIPDNTAGDADVLPKPISDEILKLIEEKNYCRKLFRIIPMANRSLTIPSITFSRKVEQSGGYNKGSAEATGDNTFSVGAMVLEAGKLIAKGALDGDDMDDSSLALVDILLGEFADAFAEAEEKIMLIGTERNRAVKTLLSHSIGISTLAAAGTSIAGQVYVYDKTEDYAVTNIISEMISGLKKYGRDKKDLVLFIDSSVGHLIRTDRSTRADVLGAGGAITGNEITKLYGVDVIETSYLDAVTGPLGTDINNMVLVKKSDCLIGDRKKLKIETDKDIKNDKIDYACTERIDFQMIPRDSGKYAVARATTSAQS